MKPRLSASLKENPQLYNVRMQTIALAALVVVITFAGLTFHTSQAGTIEPLHFHHVHLNSINPKAAAEYYPKPFALSATKTTFNGFEAVKTGNVYFSSRRSPPRRRTS